MRRDLSGIIKTMVTVIGVAAVIAHLYFSITGPLAPLRYRALHLSFLLPLAFILYPASQKSPKGHPSIIDYFFSVLSLVSLTYIWLIDHERIISRMYQVDPIMPLDYVFGTILFLLVLEATRRIVGIPLTAIGTVIFLYATNLGTYIPGRMGHAGFSLASLVDQFYLSTSGIFGLAMGVSASFIFLFIVFGTFLEVTGTGDTIIRLARIMVGSAKGGPAKVAVVGSGLMGMISGSPVANVVTTGSITIPMMKKLGYNHTFAAAVEAAASTGGQIMPPLMAAAAFVLAEFTGVPYVSVIAAAFIPALLYFAAILLMVHFESEKLGMEGYGKSSLKELKDLIIQRGHQLLPLILLVFLLLRGFSPHYAASYSLISIPIISWLRKDTRMSISGFIKASEEGTKNGVMIAVTLCTAGIVIGSINLTGIGIKLASIILGTFGDVLIFALPVIMVASIILGMGIPTTAAYITASAVMVPALVRLDVEPFVAHFFVLYFATLSTITPPVAVAAYAAAGVAGTKAMPTALTAMRLAIVAFIVPYLIVFSPTLLGLGSAFEVTRDALTAFLGVFFLAGGLQGWLLSKTNILERAGMLVTAALLIFPLFVFTDLVGIVLGAVLLSYQLIKRRKAQAEQLGLEL